MSASLRSTVLPLALAAATAALGGAVVWQAERIWAADQRDAASRSAAGAAFALEQQVSRALSATYALSALVRHDEAMEDFERLAPQLLPLFKGVASLQLAPGAVIRRIHPLAGNEAALGHDLLRDPDRRLQAQAAVDSRQLTVAGPFELKQGGMGLVGRLAVFLPDPSQPGGERLWGLVTALVRLPPLLEEAKLRRLEQEGYRWRLTRLDPEKGAPGPPRPGASAPGCWPWRPPWPSPCWPARCCASRTCRGARSSSAPRSWPAPTPPWPPRWTGCGRPRGGCARARSWRPSASSPGGSPTTSTTCSPASWATPPCWSSTAPRAPRPPRPAPPSPRRPAAAPS